MTKYEQYRAEFRAQDARLALLKELLAIRVAQAPK